MSTERGTDLGFERAMKDRSNRVVVKKQPAYFHACGGCCEVGYERASVSHEDTGPTGSKRKRRVEEEVKRIDVVPTRGHQITKTSAQC